MWRAKGHSNNISTKNTLEGRKYIVKSSSYFHFNPCHYRLEISQVLGIKSRKKRFSVGTCVWRFFFISWGLWNRNNVLNPTWSTHHHVVSSKFCNANIMSWSKRMPNNTLLCQSTIIYCRVLSQVSVSALLFEQRVSQVIRCVFYIHDYSKYNALRCKSNKRWGKIECNSTRPQQGSTATLEDYHYPVYVISMQQRGQSLNPQRMKWIESEDIRDQSWEDTKTEQESFHVFNV